ncbi:MAG: glycosyltransferase family 2 protein [Candidatus Pacebacteria bacterium]|nr:glycosyltransferase family 2 protein [Candidatus Paceibacterota bacterium]
MLSVALAVYNEEKNLGECLESVKNIADEIIVVDGESTDKTAEIARLYGAKVISAKKVAMFHINKQKALDAAKGDWILQLDADERVSEELADQIKKVMRGVSIKMTGNKKKLLFERHQRSIEERDGKIGSDSGEVTAYFIPRLNFFLGGWLRHGGVYPDGVIRFVKKNATAWPCKYIHEQPKVHGKIAWLSADLLHYADPTFSRYLMRANRYTSLTAEQMRKNDIKTTLWATIYYMCIKPVQVFLQLYLRHKGILDGFPGFVWALFSGLHYPLAYMKYWEMIHA